MQRPGDQRVIFENNRADGNSTNHYGHNYTNNHYYDGPARNQCLRDLRVTDPRHDRERIEREKDKLLKECYAWILDDTSFQWWRTQSNSRLLWINGGPGKGKTMMTMGIIDELVSDNELLVSYYFCQSTRPELRTAVSVLRGLLYRLILQRTELIQHVLRRYETAGKQLFEGDSAIYALKEILSDILNDDSLPTTYLLVDALDECTSGLGDLLHIITDDSLARRSKVKWLVTSRTLPDIQRYLQPDSLGVNISLEVSTSHVSKAVSAFVNVKVHRLAAAQGYDRETQVEVLQVLREKAEGTFLWVSLVCKELETVELYRVREVLQELPPGLDPLYKRMMGQILAHKHTQTTGFCVDILRSVTLAYRPLRLEEVAAASALPIGQFYNIQAVTDLIGRCGSFLTVRENTVFLVHLSVKDYFTLGNGQQLFGGTVIEEQGRMVHRLLDALQSMLERDICKLQSPGARIQEAISRVVNSKLPKIAYACEFWIQHLEACASKCSSILLDGGKVHSFFQEHILHWLEAMALLRRIPEAILALQMLQQVLTGPESTTVSKLVHDALRFTMWSGLGIQEAPLQLYYSALIFAPERSIMRRQFFQEEPAGVQVQYGLDEDWGPLLQVLEGYTEEINSVAFSPAGDRLVSASHDKLVRVWDGKTGQLLHTLEGHRDGVRSVAFSPAGDRLASASCDKIVRVWDANVGQLLQTLKSHIEEATSVAFSPAGDRLASASYDTTVRIWDINTGQLLRTLKGHKKEVNSVAFSPIGDQLASASDDTTVRVWDINTGRLLHTLKRHADGINSIAFSLAGDRLASASQDMTIRIWDVKTWRLLRIFTGHIRRVNSVAFSPAGDQLASASDDITVRVWDINTGRLLRIYNNRPGWVISVAFSPAGDRLASASEDSIVRVWDTKTSQPLYTHKDYIGTVYRVLFSPAGDRLASASDDTMVRIWNVNTGQLLHTLESCIDHLGEVAFSPIGDRLASTLEKTVRIWDVNKGQLLHTLEGHIRRVNSVAFSPAGDQLASASNDITVRVWDINTGRLLHTLKGHADGINSIAFSLAGDRLASASQDMTIRMWDVKTWRLLRIFKGHTDYVNSVVFSPAGDLLASTSWDKTVRVWNANTGRLLRKYKGNTDRTASVVFSPAGDRLASVLFNQTIQVWDVNTGRPLHTLKGYGVLEILAFSQDGSCLETDVGTIPLPSSSSSTSVLSTSQHIFIKDSWLTVDTEDRLWLPVNYRPCASAVSDRRVAIGCAAGHVLLLKF